MHKSSTRLHGIPYGMLVLLFLLALLPIDQVSAQLWNPLDTKPRPNFLVGLVPSETLRLCLAFPESSRRSDRPIQVVGVRFRVYDTEGDVIAQSEEIAVRERQTRCWDVARSALSRLGETSTGRLQVRGEIIIVASQPFNPQQARFVSSAEIIDSQTGETKFQLQIMTQDSNQTEPL